MYKMKAEGTFVRSRQKWLEQGEQMSSYFFKLEKSQAKHNSILQLNIEGNVTDIRRVSPIFVINILYKTKFNGDAMSAFANHLNGVNSIG